MVVILGPENDALTFTAFKYNSFFGDPHLPPTPEEPPCPKYSEYVPCLSSCRFYSSVSGVELQQQDYSVCGESFRGQRIVVNMRAYNVHFLSTRKSSVALTCWVSSVKKNYRWLLESDFIFCWQLVISSHLTSHLRSVVLSLLTLLLALSSLISAPTILILL